MAQVQVNVGIPDPAEFEKTVREAKKVGLSVQNTLEVIGVATGTIDERALPALHRVSGVGSVELSRQVGIPSPVSGRKP